MTRSSASGKYGDPSAETRISSFEKNPEKGGKPAMAQVAIRNVQAVIGIFFHNPPMLRMSCSPLMAWMTDPDPRNKQALKNAWVTRWKMPAVNAPTPTPMNKNPDVHTRGQAS